MVEFKNILCPIDLSDASARPLAYAAAFTRWYGARFTVLHVVPTFDPMQVRSGSLGDPVRIVRPMPREQVLDELRAALGATRTAMPNVTFAAKAGNTVATIVDRTVAMPADLLVMGTHGRSGFDRLLLGSVTEKVLRKAPCPHPDGATARAREGAGGRDVQADPLSRGLLAVGASGVRVCIGSRATGRWIRHRAARDRVAGRRGPCACALQRPGPFAGIWLRMLTCGSRP